VRRLVLVPPAGLAPRAMRVAAALGAAAERGGLRAMRVAAALGAAAERAVVPYAGLAALRRLRPDAVVATLPVGHIPQIEDPDGFAAALERILAAL
jgi:pimeloyl-ACP methyl ester carboxylesterase